MEVRIHVDLPLDVYIHLLETPTGWYKYNTALRTPLLTSNSKCCALFLRTRLSPFAKFAG